MDKLISQLLSTTWGKSFIGWTCIASFVSMAAVGWAYMSLLDDYKESERRLTDETERLNLRLQKCWEDRLNDMIRFHARQDTLETLKIKKRR